MLPGHEAFLAGLRLFARRRYAKPIVLDERGIAAALDHAALLSKDSERDEPAALFFACASRARAFGKVASDLLPLIAWNHARGLGLRLDLDDVVLAILHTRIALGAIGFDEVRGTLAAALHPVDEEPKPPPRRPG
jgi:hypothetical protein